MPRPPTASAPDVPAHALVLSGGGARGAYQAGALAYMAEAVPQAQFSIYTGV
ncbi:MAG: patatin, partial [Bacteroidetes bacterium]|nr:patatin [Bacteroidota bacterium]